MKYLEETDHYTTSDLLTSCVLVYFGHTIEAIDSFDENRCKFIIKRENYTDEVLQNFHKRLLSIEPNKFHAIQRELKSRIHNN